MLRQKKSVLNTLKQELKQVSEKRLNFNKKTLLKNSFFII